MFCLHYKNENNFQADVNFTRISEFKHAPNQPAGVKEHPGLLEIWYKRVFSLTHIFLLQGLSSTRNTAQMSEIRTTLCRTRETKSSTLNIRCVTTVKQMETKLSQTSQPWSTCGWGRGYDLWSLALTCTNATDWSWTQVEITYLHSALQSSYELFIRKG